MITTLEDRGDCAYIVENGVGRIIPKEDEYQAKLVEFNNQNKTMEEEVKIDETSVEETAPETPEIAPDSDLSEETTDVPTSDETSEVGEDLADNAYAGEDTPVDEAELG